MLKAIFVDDEPITTEMLKRLLDWDALGIQIAGTASNGQQALALVEAARPDIAIVDIRMPVMDGLQLMEELKRRRLSVAVVVLSAYGEFAYAQKAIACGASGYLLKPVEEDKLLELMLSLRDTIALERQRATAYAASRQAGDSSREAPAPLAEPGAAIPDTSGRACIEQTKAYIRDHFASDIALESIAEQVCISKSYLCKLFLQAEGMHVWDYLTVVRIAKAKELLRSTELKNYEIAALIGYESVHYFSKIFKKTVGITPVRFKNRGQVPS